MEYIKVFASNSPQGLQAEVNSWSKSMGEQINIIRSQFSLCSEITLGDDNKAMVIPAYGYCITYTNVDVVNMNKSE